MSTSGFSRPKAKPCAVSGAKHKWTFVRNGTVRKTSGGFGGTSVQLSLRGLYRCECGMDRIGAARHDQPGADVRDHVQEAA